MGGGNAEQCGGSPGGAQRRRREGTTLLRALTTAFGGKLIRLNLALAIGSAAQIFQVRSMENGDGMSVFSQGELDTVVRICLFSFVGNCGKIMPPVNSHV